MNNAIKRCAVLILLAAALLTGCKNKKTQPDSPTINNPQLDQCMDSASSEAAKFNAMTAKEKSDYILIPEPAKEDDQSVSDMLQQYGIEDSVDPSEDISQTKDKSGVIDLLLEKATITPTQTHENEDGSYTVSFSVQAPDMSGFFQKAKNSEIISQEELLHFAAEFINSSELVTTVVDVQYTTNGKDYSGDLCTPEFINAVTGGLLYEYRDEINDTWKMIMEEDQ